MPQNIPISERDLGELFPERLTWSLCIHIDKGTEVWVVTGMLVQYLESATDSVIVRDSEHNPIGTIGGKEIMENLLKNPTSSLFYGTKVEDIMEPNPVEVSKETKYKDLMNYWKERDRAYAIIPNEWGFYSAISAQKILEIGMKCKSNLAISDLPKKQPITFKKGDTFGSIIHSMFENKARKALLEGTNKYLSDRLIIEAISEKMKHLKETDDFLNEPVDIVELEEAKIIYDDLKINEVSKMMYDMAHPFIIYKDWLITPWDICKVLLSPEITEYVVK
ncbi:MAG: CBS domain-containing protein [Nitrosopumilus sp.]|nr:CBS domain-containing protein [Nitrosopumilus sp.]